MHEVTFLKPGCELLQIAGATDVPLDKEGDHPILVRKLTQRLGQKSHRSTLSARAYLPVQPRSGSVVQPNVAALRGYVGLTRRRKSTAKRLRLVSVSPTPNAPVGRGHLCVKGRYAFDFVSANDRVIEPQIRKDGDWRPVSWDEAFNFVAQQLQRIVKNHGPDAIVVLGSARGTNEENYLTQKFARIVLGTNNVDCCARVSHADGRRHEVDVGNWCSNEFLR